MLTSNYRGDEVGSPQYISHWNTLSTPPPEFGAANGLPLFTVPSYDAAAMRHRLYRLCDPLDLLAYMGQRFATTTPTCAHTFALIDAYFAVDPQQAVAVYRLLEDLGVACDCEAFFVLQTLTG